MGLEQSIAEAKKKANNLLSKENPTPAEINGFINGLDAEISKEIAAEIGKLRALAASPSNAIQFVSEQAKSSEQLAIDAITAFAKGDITTAIKALGAITYPDVTFSKDVVVNGNTVAKAGSGILHAVAGTLGAEAVTVDAVRKIIEKVVAKGGNIDKRDKEGETALERVVDISNIADVRKKQLAAVETFVENNATITPKVAKVALNNKDVTYIIVEAEKKKGKTGEFLDSLINVIGKGEESSAVPQRDNGSVPAKSTDNFIPKQQTDILPGDNISVIEIAVRAFLDQKAANSQKIFSREDLLRDAALARYEADFQQDTRDLFQKFHELLSNSHAGKALSRDSKAAAAVSQVFGF